MKFGESVICRDGYNLVTQSNLNLEVNKYEEIKEKAKELNLKYKKINDYEFEKFMAFYYEDNDIEHMELEKIYEVECINDNMYSFIIDYKSENELLSINIDNSKKYREVERMEENITSWHGLIKRDDEDYELMVDKNNSDIILGVYYKKKIDGRNFFIRVYFGKTNAVSQEGAAYTKEEINALVKETGVIYIIDEIIQGNFK